MSTTAPDNPYFEEDSFDFKKYLFLFLANWYWFIISIFLSLGIAWLVNRYTLPVYEVTGSLINNDNSKSRSLSVYENMIPGMEIYRNRNTLATEIDVLKSPSLAERTLKELNFNIT